ncbi:MAG: leukotriene A4 hydrolase C-terminal domain-containing protein [Myxococcota bacterium]
MRMDPHSYADDAQGRVARVDLEWTVDFDARRLRGTATLTLAEAGAGPLDLDTRDLDIESVESGDGTPVPFSVDPRDDVLGQRLRVDRDRPLDILRIRYRTSTEASALMWLSPAQTAGGVHPFLLSQCQAIHARSLAPLQDTPRVRIRYGAHLTVPLALSAVMSAGPPTEVARTATTKTLRFDMPQPIPPYLMAIAVGDLAARDLGPRTRVYAEPSQLDAAAWEFAEAEETLEAAEALFGPYPWERYDFVVMPPAFPYGGMENPRMTFLTPTIVAGDRSLVSVLAHELAHSWTGNLVTNATNQDFWLNEGFTVYAERRLVEVLYGTANATLHARLGRLELEEVLAERAAAGRPTALWYDQTGLDPDGEFSRIPYEKGFLLVTAIERAVGREAFDAFLHRYIERFAFASIDTATFQRFLAEALPDLDLDLSPYLFENGLPEGAPEFPSRRWEELRALARTWSPGDGAEALNADAWTTTETLLFLQALAPLDAAGTEALAEALGLRQSSNAELQCVWLSRAISAGVADVMGEVEAYVARVGRTKLLKPVFAALATHAPPAAARLAAAYSARWHIATQRAVSALLAD